MPTDNQQPEEQQHQQQPASEGTGKYNPASLDDAQKIIEALTKRVGEREATIDELKKSSGTLAERLAQIEQAQKKRLEEEGNWAELAKQRAAELDALKPYQERAQTLEGIIRQSNEERVKRIPEAVRPLVPVDYPPEKLQAWLNANEGRLMRPAAPDYNAGAGAGGSAGAGLTVTDQDRRLAEVAKGNGFDIKAEDIAKRRLEQQQANQQK